MESPTIYCQMGFLEQFIKKATESLDSLFLDDNTSVDSISACFKLLYGKSTINIDVSPEKLTANEHPMVKKFIKNPTASFYCNTEIKANIVQDTFWQNTSTEVFMLDMSENEAASLESDWGVMILTMETLSKKERLLKPSPPIFINHNQDHFQWDILAFAKHYFHSAIIVDNYINAKEQELKNNILPLILSLSQGAPKKRQLNLSIVTSADNIQGILDMLHSLLTQNNIKANLSISKTQTLQNHDRHCITNQLWISSGFGFNILSFNHQKRKLIASRDTTLFIQPRMSNDHLIPINESDTQHNGTYFSASHAIMQRMNTLIEISKTDRGTQKWFVKKDCL